MINTYSQNGEVEYGITEYTLDSRDDLEGLQKYAQYAAPGSSAFIIATGDTYMLNSLREWVQI